MYKCREKDAKATKRLHIGRSVLSIINTKQYNVAEGMYEIALGISSIHIEWR